MYIYHIFERSASLREGLLCWIISLYTLLLIKNVSIQYQLMGGIFLFTEKELRITTHL